MNLKENKTNKLNEKEISKTEPVAQPAVTLDEYDDDENEIDLREHNDKENEFLWMKTHNLNYHNVCY